MWLGLVVSTYFTSRLIVLIAILGLPRKEVPVLRPSAWRCLHLQKSLLPLRLRISYLYFCAWAALRQVRGWLRYQKLRLFQ